MRGRIFDPWALPTATEFIPSGITLENSLSYCGDDRAKTVRSGAILHRLPSPFVAIDFLGENQAASKTNRSGRNESEGAVELRTETRN